MMKQQIRSQRFLQQRKFLLVLPLLVLPFATLIFWALGGGKVANSRSVETQSALNMDLPDAYLNKDKSLDKMSYYHLARMDSNKRKKQRQNDPYYRDNSSSEQSETTTANNKITLPSLDSEAGRTGNKGSYSNPNVAKVYRKLDQLDSVLNKPVTAPEKVTAVSAEINPQKNMGISSADINRLEQMMQVMNRPDENDPEMKQLNNMLEKIINIQHPQRIAKKLKAKSLAKRGQVFSVFTDKSRLPISTFGGKDTTSEKNMRMSEARNKFYSLNDPGTINQQPNAIEAVIHETRTLVNGSTIKLRLMNNVYINGVLIPKGHFIYGKTSLEGERLHIEIKSIRYKHSIFPVDLLVYDLDGMKGIYVPGAITRKVAKRSAGSTIQGLGLTTLNSSLSAQAASAGIDAVKDLVNQKVKLVKVTVKAGYRVLLKNEKE